MAGTPEVITDPRCPIEGQPFEQRLDPSPEIQLGGPISPEPEETTGIAFSGGGIRSAAFSSGALRRMLQDNVLLEYLSCVSGGGYTGAAFLDWKKRKRTTNEEWHGEFFENMRNNAGYLCNWQSPLRGICQSIYFTFLLIFVVIISPCVLWLPHAFPVAVFVDFLFGGILRENSTCPPSVSMGAKTSFLILDLYGDCQPPGRRVALFVITFAFWVVFVILSRTKIKGQNCLRFFSILSGLVLALTFFPWVTHDFLWPLKTWIKVLVFIIFLVLPFFFPIIRNFAAIFLFFYAYTLVVSWRIFKGDLFGVFPYSDEVFYPILIGCAIAVIFFPVIGSIHRSLFNIYYRHRLSDAFFVKAAGCHWQDVFPNCVRPAGGIFDLISRVIKRLLRDNVEDANKELTLDDLNDVLPIFISNITVNDWQISSDAKSSHQLISFSSKGVELIGDDWEKPSKLSKCFDPKHMRLSAAMAISGAAVSYDMGRRESGLNMVLDLLNLLGIGMGDEIVSDQCHFEKQSKSKVGKMTQYVLPFLIENCFVLALPFAYWVAHNKHWVEYLVLVHIAVVVLLTVLAMAKTGSTPPGRWERFLSWCIRHTFFVRFIRGFLSINNVGKHPPPILRLSDGGHFENLALLPLLDKKLKKIVIFDGSYNPGDPEKYADSLLTTLKLAREKLHCWFEGMSGRDIKEDIRVEFLEKESPERPRSYKFKVHYYDQADTNLPVSEGEILFIAPRHPSETRITLTPETTQPKSWKDFGMPLDSEKWKGSPELTVAEADKLTFCCCPCCHCSSSSCRCISKRLLGKFPHHITANQFFTPDTFTAYHREGYAACVEAGVADFLST